MPRRARFAHQRFEDMIERRSGCWIWRGCFNRHGNPSFTIGSRVTGNRRKESAKRFAYRFYVGPIPAASVVYNICRPTDRRPCVNPDHLAVGSRSACRRFQIGVGMYSAGDGSHFPKDQIGEKNPAAKLKDAQCAEIRRARGAVKLIVLARRYGVSEATISGIWRGTTRTRPTPSKEILLTGGKDE